MSYTTLRPDRYFDSEAERLAQQGTVSPGLTAGERDTGDVYVRTVTGWLSVESGGAKHFYASTKIWETVNIVAGDHAPALTGGVAKAMYCSQAGEVLKIDTTLQTGYTTPPLQAGFNPMEVTKVYQTGSTIAGTVAFVSW